MNKQPNNRVQGFIVIGNFSIQTDGSIETTFNRASGLTEQNFSFLMQAEARQHGLQILSQMDDAIVLKGNEKDMRRLKSRNGARFSYYFSDDKDAIENMLVADQEYMAAYLRIDSEQRSSHSDYLGTLDA